MVPISDVLTLIFVWVDDLVKALSPVRPGPSPQMSDSEILTLLILKELCGIKRDREWHRFVQRYWSGFFPLMVSWSRFHRRTQVCQPLLEPVRQGLVACLEREFAERGEPTEPWRVDSTPVQAVEWVRSRYSQYYGDGLAAYGQKTAHRQGYFGYRLHLLTTTQGVPVAFDLAPADQVDGTLLPELTEQAEGVVIGGDSGYVDAPEHERLFEEQHILMVVPPRKNQIVERTPEVALWTRSARRAFHAWRQKIESLIKILKDQMNLEEILARSTLGFIARVHRKVTALTFGIWVNLMLGRPLLQIKDILA